MLLAVFPLIFAWRSLPSYFFCSIYPMFILMAAKTHPYYSTTQRYLVPLLFNSNSSNEHTTQSIPASVAMHIVIHLPYLLRQGTPLHRLIRSTNTRSWLPSAWHDHKDDGSVVQGG